MKINIEYTKEQDKIHIVWKVDNKKKQKFKLDSYLETDKHFGILRQFMQQFNQDIVISCHNYVDCDYNRLKGYQDQQEIIEIISAYEDETGESQYTRTYLLKEFSIPLVAMDLIKLYNLDIELNVNFEGF